MTIRHFFREDLFTESPNKIALLAAKCTSCGRLAFPKKDFCAYCLNKEMESIELGHRGILFTYTITYMPASKFKLPHAMGYIELPEGVRIFSPLVMDKRGFEIGSEMEMIIDPFWIEDDSEIMGYKFRRI